MFRREKFKQKGGVITLLPGEREVFDLISKIYSYAEGEDRKKITTEIENKIESLLKTTENIKTLNKDTPLREYDYYKKNPQNTYYSYNFLKILENFENLIFSHENNDDVIYVSVGKIFSKFNCDKHDYNNRFVKYILDLYKVKTF